MNRAVYRYLLSTFGRAPGYWVGFAAGLIQSVSGRVGLAMVQAYIVSAMSQGNISAVYQAIWWYMGIGTFQLSMRYIRDTVGNSAENNVYTRLMV
jgi:hypothetical protein